MRLPHNRIKRLLKAVEAKAAKDRPPPRFLARDILAIVEHNAAAFAHLPGYPAALAEFKAAVLEGEASPADWDSFVPDGETWRELEEHREARFPRYHAAVVVMWNLLEAATENRE